MVRIVLAALLAAMTVPLGLALADDGDGKHKAEEEAGGLLLGVEEVGGRLRGVWTQTERHGDLVRIGQLQDTIEKVLVSDGTYFIGADDLVENVENLESLPQVIRLLTTDLHGLSYLPVGTREMVFVSRVGEDGAVEVAIRAPSFSRKLAVFDRSVLRPKGEDAILKKLDEIIERLDALEKEVRDLKAGSK